MDKQNYYHLGGLLLSLSLLSGGCATAPDAPQPIATPVATSVAAPVAAPVATPVKTNKTVQIRPDYPQRYRVVMGDTLWGISSRFLKDPWRWPEVWQNNPQVDNPHLIYPGDLLTLHYVDGVPYIKVERTSAHIAAREPYPTVKLSPKIHQEKIENAIVTIPTEAISAFLIKPRVVTMRELADAPYVVSSVDGHLIGGAGTTLYIRNLGSEPTLRYTIVRQGDPYIDPDSGAVLGYEATYIAEGKIIRTGDPASFQVNYAKREILIGDRLLMSELQQAERNYFPRAPELQIDAQIISVVDGLSMIGQYQIVALNLGRQDEVEPGHVLAVYRSGTIIHDRLTSDKIELPEEQSGVVMIFRVFDRVSYALVMETTAPLHIHDRVTNP